MIRVRDSSRLTGIHDHLPRGGGDRPHPRASGRSTCWPRSPSSSGGPRVRHLAGARVVLLGLFLVFACLAWVFFRPGSASRLMALSGLVRVPLGARPSSRPSRPRCTSIASDRARSGRAFVASLALQTIVGALLLRGRPRPAHRPAPLRLLPDGAALHPAAGRARFLQRLGPARGRLRRLLRPGRPAPGERPRLQPGGRGPHRPALPLGRRGLGLAAARPQPEAASA